ncbi:MAG TPA: helix-turn-helix domain-containing protein [Intrasporangium sp.]|uniref:TetR/AcrR family transcriptional regulator n=1 Tax=Intrasporangium sp. TaxID=1925024 RepID=UPI002B48A581|nr:helix-turn-helix domain-containing protein [Intrasporangium sp.]HKX68295.1 helix-turn-helix domain-containing protein [Intrasporangium sp.]
MPVDEPQNARGRRTREALLSAARRLVEERGFESVTLAAVAESAGVSHRALYLHFHSRSDLLTTLYRHLGVTEDLVSSLARVWDSADAVSALSEWASHIARSHPRILAINRAIERARFTDPDAAALWDLTMRNWLKSCRRLAAWLDDEGSLSERWTVQSAADMLWTLMSWDVTERLVVSRRWSERRYAEMFGDLLLSTFTRKG